MRGAPQSWFSMLIRQIRGQVCVDLRAPSPRSVTSSANNGENQPYANVGGSRVGR